MNFILKFFHNELQEQFNSRRVLLFISREFHSQFTQPQSVCNSLYLRISLSRAEMTTVKTQKTEQDKERRGFPQGVYLA